MKANGLTVVVVLVLLAVVTAPALALDPMGPPKADLPKGQYSLGVEYVRSEMDIVRMTANWSDAKAVSDATIDKMYANIGYGISDNVTGFVRLGAGQADFDRTASWTKWKGDGDAEFIWGAGMKATLAQDADIAWGLLGQMSRGKLTGDATSTLDGEREKYEVTMYEIQIAAGPTFMLGNNVQVYGGPFLHFISGDYKDIKDDGDKLHKPIDTDDEFGGYVGALVTLGGNAALNAEYQVTGGDSAVAGGVTFRF